MVENAAVCSWNRWNPADCICGNRRVTFPCHAYCVPGSCSSYGGEVDKAKMTSLLMVIFEREGAWNASSLQI